MNGFGFDMLGGFEDGVWRLVPLPCGSRESF
jgi:hypothetical protein